MQQSLSFGSKDMLCAAEMEKEKEIKPLGSRMSGNAALEATHHSCRHTGFPAGRLLWRGRFLWKQLGLERCEAALGRSRAAE